MRKFFNWSITSEWAPIILGFIVSFGALLQDAIAGGVGLVLFAFIAVGKLWFK